MLWEGRAATSFPAVLRVSVVFCKFSTCMGEGGDVLKFLTAGTHFGGTNLDFQMEQYIYIINLRRTWEKLLLAARAIVAIENPADVSVISSRNNGQRAKPC
ncbi:40S ribosomal protein SA [Lemmus lemmus]